MNKSAILNIDYDDTVFRSSSLRNTGSNQGVDEELYDSDDEESTLKKFDNAPEIEESSRRVDGTRHYTKTLHDSCWKWAGKGLKSAEDTGKLRVLAMTWNMYGRKGPPDLNEMLPKHSKHHIYILSFQECMRSIGSSLLYSSKKAWQEQLKTHLGEEYVLIESGTVGATYLITFYHVSIFHLVNQVDCKTVATGVGNIIGNKGAVAVFFNISGTTVLAIGCHLAAGQNSVNQRNSDFCRILNEVFKQSGKTIETVDCCIFLGDLNYRINGSREDVEILIGYQMIDTLKTGDQLIIEMKKNTLFNGFREGFIDFAPTYKFNFGTNDYDTSKKKRIPSWTDRILYRCLNDCLDQVSYGSIFSCMHSDHKPVFSQFVLKYNTINAQHLPTKVEKSRACLIF
jgi:hypothetical protein